MPGVTGALATPLEPLPHNPAGFGEALLQAGGVAMDSVVVVVPAEVGVEPLEQPWEPEGAVLLTPRGAALQSGPAFLPCGPAFEVLLPRTLLAPPTLAPQKLDAHVPGLSVPTARDEPCLGRRPRPSDLLQPSPQHVVAAFRIGWVCERAPEIGRVAPPTRVAPTVPVAPFCNPSIEHGVQEHLGEYG